MCPRKNTTLFVVSISATFCDLCSSLACPLYRSPSDFVSLFPISVLFCVLAVPVASVDVDLSVPAEKGHGNLNCAVLTKRQYVSVTKAWAVGASDF